MALRELENKKISITISCEGDKANTGYREVIKKLGFAEAGAVERAWIFDAEDVWAKGGR